MIEGLRRVDSRCCLKLTLKNGFYSRMRVTFNPSVWVQPIKTHFALKKYNRVQQVSASII